MDAVIPAMRVSLESPHSDTQHSDAPQSHLSAKTESRRTDPLNASRRQLLQTALTAAESQRTRPLNASTLPWLFSAAGQLTTGLQRCRMTESAQSDLQTFNTCLKSLPKAEVTEAIQGLTATLAKIAQTPASIPTTPEFPGVRRVCNADAELYFRIVDGEAELLRVLPADIETDVPFGPASESIRRTASHR
jgi:hypothetical protein